MTVPITHPACPSGGGGVGLKRSESGFPLTDSAALEASGGDLPGMQGLPGSGAQRRALGWSVIVRVAVYGCGWA